MSISTTFSAGTTQEFYLPGNFFRILDSTGPVTVEFYGNTGAEISEAVNVLAGYGEAMRQKFQRVRITSASAQTVQFVVRDGSEVRYDRAAGNVAVTNINGAFTQTTATVTTASAQLRAANAARRYLLIQNKDATGIVYVNLAGAAATVAGGVQLDPGASLELQGFVPTGAVFAIGSIASNANVIVVEG